MPELNNLIDAHLAARGDPDPARRLVQVTGFFGPMPTLEAAS